MVEGVLLAGQVRFLGCGLAVDHHNMTLEDLQIGYYLVFGFHDNDICFFGLELDGGSFFDWGGLDLDIWADAVGCVCFRIHEMVGI